MPPKHTHNPAGDGEYSMWDRASVRVGIAQLEQVAMDQGKKLILVTQGENDLADAGILFQTPVAKLRLEGRTEAVILEYDGRKIRFPS